MENRAYNHVLFIQPEREAFFRENGYIILKNVLTSEIKSIQELYLQTLATKSKEGLYESTGANSAQENNLINNRIKEIITPFVQENFQRFSFYGGAFLVKSNHQSTELPLHQDWSFVNEEKDSALFFWMPLHTVNKENGTIFLIRRSHHFFDLYRSGAYNSNRIPRMLIPDKFILTVELNAGDILIYSPALFHGSYKNKSKQERVASTALLTNENALFQYVHKKDKSTAEIYAIEPSSYLNDINYLSKGKVPPGAKLEKTIPYRAKRVSTLKLLLQLIREPQ